ncbi:MAG TPA: pitrilysin family protein [Verrucomicrobiae bacterium]|nr:pitrilysin family protein [Verrucomicrobiae bacterium]
MLDCKVSRLPSGLTVATAKLHGADSVTVGIWTGTGGRFEDRLDCGAAHFLEHLLFKGTAARTARQISEAVEGIGGYLNASTGEESTCYYARAQAVHLPRLVDVLLDMFLEAALPPREIVRERDVIREEILMTLDQPASHVEDLLNDALWPNHPLGRPITGTVESVQAISRARLVAFRARNYRASNTVVAAAGPMDHEEFLRLVTGSPRRWRTGPRPRCRRATRHQSRPRFRLLAKETEQAHLAIGIRAFSRHDPRRSALRLLSVMLGENMSSRLFQELREKRGLAYAVSSGVSHLSDDGLLHIAAGLEPSRAPDALRLIIRELSRLRLRTVTTRELRRAKDYAIGTLLLGLEGSAAQANWVAESLLAFGRMIQPDEFVRQMRAVSATDIRDVAHALLRPSRLSLALIAPEFSRDALDSAVSRLD